MGEDCGDFLGALASDGEAYTSTVIAKMAGEGGLRDYWKYLYPTYHQAVVVLYSRLGCPWASGDRGEEGVDKYLLVANPGLVPHWTTVFLIAIRLIISTIATMVGPIDTGTNLLPLASRPLLTSHTVACCHVITATGLFPQLPTLGASMHESLGICKRYTLTIITKRYFVVE